MARGRKRAASAGPTPVEALVHDDSRVNIPTADAYDFIDEQAAQVETLRYPRDPSLDPQLVWKGKDEQDASDLVVDAPPIFIQEKIDPRVLIENLRDTARAGGQEPELTLFDSFDGLEGWQTVEFYRHAANWSNRMILGDSLQVMASLAEKESLRGQVQMVYVDPPYGIKFGSNWQVSTRKRDVKDGKIEDATREVEQIKAFRDTWEQGIHSYLSYLRDRLTMARDLLTESGSIFVQIGDENIHLVRAVLDEVFGTENFVSMICITKTAGASSELLSGVADYVLWFSKSRTDVKYRQLYRMKTPGDEGAVAYTHAEMPNGTHYRVGLQLTNEENVRYLAYDNLTSQRPPGDFPVEFEGRTFRPAPGYWKTGVEGMERLRAARRLARTGNTLRYVRYLDDFQVAARGNVWTDTATAMCGPIQPREASQNRKSTSFKPPTRSSSAASSCPPILGISSSTRLAAPAPPPSLPSSGVGGGLRSIPPGWRSRSRGSGSWAPSFPTTCWRIRQRGGLRSRASPGNRSPMRLPAGMCARGLCTTRCRTLRLSRSPTTRISGRA